jgi:hypothetical protein
MPAWMPTGLSRLHVTGLAVLGGALRHLIAVRRPLLAPAAWRGPSIGTYRSGVQEQAIRALGATPVVVAFGRHPPTTWPLGRCRDSSSTCSGTCITCRRAAGATSQRTVRCGLYRRAVRQPGPARLPHRPAARLAPAGRPAGRRQIGEPSRGPERPLHPAGVRDGCPSSPPPPGGPGRPAPGVHPVYRSLDAGPQTRAFIRQIQQPKRTSPPGRVRRRVLTPTLGRGGPPAVRVGRCCRGSRRSGVCPGRERWPGSTSRRGFPPGRPGPGSPGPGGRRRRRRRRPPRP